MIKLQTRLLDIPVGTHALLEFFLFLGIGITAGSIGII
tara:strand:+ start:769 stop:882 length:114 start_codon:yes stop_codon:yes gene_type:complete